MAKNGWTRLLELVGSGAEGIAVSSRAAATARELVAAEKLVARAASGKTVDAAELAQARALITAREEAARLAASRAVTPTAPAGTPAATVGTPAAPRTGTPAGTPATAATPAATTGTPAATTGTPAATTGTPAAPAGTPAAPAGTPAAPHTGTPTGPAVTPTAPAGTPTAGTPGHGALAPAATPQASAVRRLFSRIGWRIPLGVAAAGGIGYGALQVDDAVRNPVQTPDQQRLQAILDKQQRDATTANVDRGKTAAIDRARRDGIKTEEVTGPIPAGRDSFERALPNAGGTGNLAAVSPVGATVRSLQETLPDGTTRRVLEFDYSNLAFGNGDKVDFPANKNGGVNLNPRELARGVYRVDDPGTRATQVTASITYSGVQKDDVLPLTGNALANRHTASVATTPAGTPAGTPAATTAGTPAARPGGTPPSARPGP